MTISRRTFLKSLAAVTVAAAGGIALDQFIELSNRQYLPDVPPGELDDDTLRVLLALTETVFAAYPLSSTAHYRRYYRYRAGHVAGERAAMQETVSRLNAAAQQQFRADFLALSAENRRTLITPHLNAYHAEQGAQALAIVLSRMLMLYMHTDAYLILGYEQWPGQARGLETYQQPVQADRTATAPEDGASHG